MRSLFVVLAFCICASLAAPFSPATASFLRNVDYIQYLANLTDSEMNTIMEISARSDSIENSNQEFEKLHSTNAELYQKVAPLNEELQKKLSALGAEVANYAYATNSRMAARYLKEEKGEFFTVEELRGQSVEDLEAYNQLSSDSRKKLYEILPELYNDIMEIIDNDEAHDDEYVKDLVNNTANLTMEIPEEH